MYKKILIIIAVCIALFVGLVFYFVITEYNNKPLFSDNLLILVKKDNKWGFLERLSGKMIDGYRYDDVQSLRTDLLAFELDHKWGVLNIKTGKLITEPKYDEISGNTYRIGNKWGVLKDNGEERTEPKYDEISGNTYRIGNKWGVLKDNGKEKTEPIYDELSYLYTDKWDISDTYKFRIGDKWGIWDSFTNIQYTPKYDEIKPSFIARIGDKWGMINKMDMDDVIIPIKYDEVDKFGQVRIGNKWGLVDYQEGFSILPVIYDQIDFNFNMTSFRSGDKWGVTQPENKITKLEYDEVKGFAYRIGNKWGILGLTTGEVITEPKYDEIGENSSFRIGNKWGFYFENQNNQIIEATLPQYDNVVNYTNYSVLFSGDKKGLKYVNWDKKPYYYSIIQPKYDDIKYTSGDTDFILAMLNGKWGAINYADEKVLTPFKYDEIRGSAYRIGNKWGVLDATGKELTEPKYDEIGENMSFRIGNKWGIFNSDFTELTAAIYDDVSVTQVY